MLFLEPAATECIFSILCKTFVVSASKLRRPTLFETESGGVVSDYLNGDPAAWAAPRLGNPAPSA